MKSQVVKDHHLIRPVLVTTKNKETDKEYLTYSKNLSYVDVLTNPIKVGDN
jgi:hypothetical protein